SRKQLAYFSITDSLKLQYKNLLRAEDLRYRYEYTSRKKYISENSITGDVFDSNRYKTLVVSGLFLDYRDVALIASMDSYQVFKQN
ncbi:2307_t:CDS:1, partial [Gigaspora margarita]